jgi:hypothetical protein
VLLLRHIKNLETRQREELSAKQTGAQGHLSFIKTAAALSVVEDGDVFLKYPFHVSWFGSKVILALPRWRARETRLTASTEADSQADGV